MIISMNYELREDMEVKNEKNQKKIKLTMIKLFCVATIILW
jgi:hypothetical protein